MMEQKMIGFIGVEKYDILLYLSKILYRLNQRVLLVDYAENQALSYCIPTPATEQLFPRGFEESEGYYIYQRKKLMQERITYQGVDFIVEPQYDTLFQLIPEYDLVLIDFGFQVYSKLISHCSKIYFCMDPQLHHIMQLKPLRNMVEQQNEKFYLIFRQVYDCKVCVSYLMEEVGIYIAEDNIYQYYEEPMDMKYCIDSQYNHTYHFMKVSKGLKSCLLFLMKTMQPGIGNKELKSAYKIARTRRENRGMTVRQGGKNADSVLHML